MACSAPHLPQEMKYGLKNAITHWVLTAEPGHLFANILIDITFLLEQVLQLAVLILEVVHFQFQALHLGLIAFLLLPLVVFQYSAIKRSNKCTQACHKGTKLDWWTVILSEWIAIVVSKSRPGSFLQAIEGFQQIFNFINLLTVLGTEPSEKQCLKL